MRSRVLAALTLVSALLLGACAQDLNGISATGYYTPKMEAQRNAVDPLFGWPDTIEAFH